MTATNHSLTGAVIGLIVDEPLLAAALAVASHFICDMIPHYGSTNPDKTMRTAGFRYYLMLDASLCFGLVLTLALLRPEHWLLAALCAFLAAAPDFFWLNKYLTALRKRKWHPNWFSHFAIGIQWFQRPIGAVVEVAWFVAAIVVLFPLITRP